MNAKKILSAALLGACLAIPSQAAGAGPESAAWQLSVTPLPTNFAPGSSGNIQEGPLYLVVATNVGAKPTSGTSTVTDTLPAPFTPPSPLGQSSEPGSPDLACAINAQTVSCEDTEPLQPGQHLEVLIPLEVDPLASGPQVDQATVQGGGAATPVMSTSTTTVGSAAPPFGFLAGPAGFSAPFGGPDGSAVSAAGSHPYQLTVNLGFPTETENGGRQISAGHLHDAIVDFPPGELFDPAATPVLCTEAQLTSGDGCPAASQVGTVTINTLEVIFRSHTTHLYNMVPPPGAPAELGFDALDLGIYVHIAGALRSDGDYGISGASDDALALTLHPVFGVSLELWGDPSSPSHDADRASAVPAQPTAFLTLPGDCAGAPSLNRAHADSWEEPGLFKEATYESADLAGNPVSVSGCNQLEYDPTITSRPTTDLADSPSGLDFHLHQPQDSEVGHLFTAAMKDATVTLPAGMSVNPSQADGLEACSEAEIGYLAEGGQAGIHFSKAPQSCPDAAKLGTVEVTTPLLAEYSEAGTKLATDPETGVAIPRPLHGSVYLAEPFQNPFGSLLAIYLAVEDPLSGTISKLAGKVEPDPATGQLRTVFEENPELPLEDVTLHLFGGARGALTTPVSCGAHTTSSDFLPWSSPEGADAHPTDSFQTTGEPGGGTCPVSEAAAKNAPAFSAGTLSPQAGAYSPFVLKLSREDGSQRLAGLDTLLPPGLSGKLAGIATCSEAQIAQAKSREHPDEGILEQSNPSCPASSEVGSVDVAAGSGPTPFHTTGHAYLAGPYKGAPLSLAVIVPALAGPFDLGAVLSRVALHVEPESARIHAVSDPFPQILDGIPLDLRSVSLTMGRPQFTLNPTSCEPMQITGSALSALGQGAALSERFQVGGCPQLPFRPKLSLRLKGGTQRTGHPKLIANLKAKGGEANIASAQVKLPPSAFLDQAHIRTICTRVQFAAGACPPGSIYGRATARTPLLDYALSGNVYLRSSNHKLPDLVVALKGPQSQPIEIDLDGKTDSVKGALRNTFEAVPDAPVSSFRLELFGGRRGLVVNSRNLCAHPYRAEVSLDGQNGKAHDTKPVMRTDCKRGKSHRGHGDHRRHHHRAQ